MPYQNEKLANNIKKNFASQNSIESNGSEHNDNISQPFQSRENIFPPAFYHAQRNGVKQNENNSLNVFARNFNVQNQNIPLKPFKDGFQNENVDTTNSKNYLLKQNSFAFMPSTHGSSFNFLQQNELKPNKMNYSDFQKFQIHMQHTPQLNGDINEIFQNAINDPTNLSNEKLKLIKKHFI